MMRLAVVLVLTTALATPVLAAQDPRPGRWDARVRTVPYSRHERRAGPGQRH